MKYLVTALSLFALPALANTPITGNVEAKCVIRFDVSIADSYTANITHPTSFSSSPTLNDTVAWTGSTSVTQTSVSGMSAYEEAKVVVDNTTIFNLTLAGSTWFSTSSSAIYGSAKPFAGGVYTALVQASCVAK